MHRAAILPHRWNHQVPMKQPDAASWRLSNANLRSGSCTVTQGRPWRWRGFDYWPDYWPFCAVLLWTEDYCYQWNQSVSWMLADGVSTQLTSSPPSASPDCILAHNSMNYSVVSARYRRAFCVMHGLRPWYQRIYSLYSEAHLARVGFRGRRYLKWKASIPYLVCLTTPLYFQIN